MLQALVGVHIAAVLALVASAVGIWRLHCEGFGCTGIGLFARSKSAAVSGLARASRAAFWFQLAVGAFAVAAWLSKSAA